MAESQLTPEELGKLDRLVRHEVGGAAAALYLQERWTIGTAIVENLDHSKVPHREISTNPGDDDRHGNTRARNVFDAKSLWSDISLRVDCARDADLRHYLIVHELLHLHLADLEAVQHYVGDVLGKLPKSARRAVYNMIDDAIEHAVTTISKAIYPYLPWDAIAKGLEEADDAA